MRIRCWQRLLNFPSLLRFLAKPRPQLSYSTIRETPTPPRLHSLADQEAPSLQHADPLLAQRRLPAHVSIRRHPSNPLSCARSVPSFFFATFKYHIPSPLSSSRVPSFPSLRAPPASHATQRCPTSTACPRRISTSGSRA